MWYARTKIVAWPARETTSKQLSCSESKIDRLNNELRDAGMLSWGKRGNSNLYTLLKYRPLKSKRAKERVKNQK
jgi:hypothetical protein